MYVLRICSYCKPTFCDHLRGVVNIQSATIVSRSLLAGFN